MKLMLTRRPTAIKNLVEFTLIPSIVATAGHSFDHAFNIFADRISRPLFKDWQQPFGVA
jgi:hypothetical protein